MAVENGPDGTKTGGSDIIRLLMVEDNTADARLIQETLTEIENLRAGITHMETLSEAIKNLETSKYDIILLDMTLPDSEWPHTLRPRR